MQTMPWLELWSNELRSTGRLSTEKKKEKGQKDPEEKRWEREKVEERLGQGKREKLEKVREREREGEQKTFILYGK